jgi:hypothetical protein
MRFFFLGGYKFCGLFEKKRKKTKKKEREREGGRERKRKKIEPLG